MAGCLISPVKEIGKCIWDSFLNSHVDYWWCFDDNIQLLKDGIEKLKQKKYSVDQEIDRARLRLEVVRPWVEEWSKASTEKLEEAQKILLPDDNIPKAWDIRSRYSLGKNAKETAEEISKHLNNGEFDLIADPTPSAAMTSPPHRSTMDFESRKGIEEAIIKSLKESSVDVIGICGMGGLGKTTMAQRIGKKVKDDNLFDEVVMVTVSQKIDILKIQEEISEWLDLKLDGKHMAIRAAKLRTRLMDTKRKIIILDDIWESLPFEDLGIPIESNSERCKVLLTSRSRDTCNRIKNKKVFELKILKEKEAWILFKEKAGECVENSALLSLAKHVAAECKGLPVALVTVGLALQDETDERIWKYSLSKLKEAKPTDLPKEIVTHVYGSLELSYERLDSHLEKRFFLLCCLFPEDYNIRLEELTSYCLGLQMFDDINIEEATNKTHTLVGKLKSRFLLIDGKDKLHVKMHDVVRDVAIYIGSKENNGFLKCLTSIKNSSDVNCNWMSVDISNERMEVPLVSLFPKLQLLMLLKSSSKEFSEISFEGMEELNVVSFQRTWIGSLPPTLGLLKNLQTLWLVHCEVENISVICELTSLKIFSCNGCGNILELPAEIGRLKGLRLLELNHCRNLQRISFGVISSLHLLEGLKIRKSFSRWEAEENGKERSNASLTELGSLPNLTCLEIEIDDCTLSVQEIFLSQNLVKYYIRIDSKDHFYYFGTAYEKVMILNLKNKKIGNWIRLLARNAEYLLLTGDGSDNINVAEMENLRNLKFNNCSTVKKLVDTKDGIVFPALEILSLEGLGNLQEICDLNQNAFLYNLKVVHIFRCSILRSVFSVSVAKTSLLQLQDLDIRRCNQLEVVFWNEGTDKNTSGCIEFPKLKNLRLEYLPNLTAFFQELENIIVNFPNLTIVCIIALPNLNSLFPVKDVSFGNLKSIRIDQCNKLRSLFSVSATRRCFLRLEDLNIQRCHAMKQVFWIEGTDDNTNGCIEFPKLEVLTLERLPNLTVFCQGLENIIVKFPNLARVWISALPNLNGLFPLKDDSCCNLKSISIWQCDKLVSLCSVFAARTCLLQLEVLTIVYCDAMEQVFWNEVTEDNTDGCIEFPKLNNLTLSDLPNLTAFCQGLENNIIKFPNLTKMTIEGLPKLNSLFPMKDVSLCNLKSIQIVDCPFRYLFSVSAPNRGLLQLEVLEIGSCDSMDKVFWNEGTDDNTDGCIEFPNLKELTLDDLPNLTVFCQGLENNIIKFPNLTKMDFTRLPKLNGLSPLNWETLVVHDQNTSLHFVCNPKVELGCLKELSLRRLRDNIRNIWCHQIPNNVFNNIEKLNIAYINGIRSLISTLIAKSLVSLKYLWIGHCGKLVEVIERDEDDDKQVVDINGLFPTLIELNMRTLPKLKKFWQWNHALELPLLKKVAFRNCPVMETFTLGSINTPNICVIEVNDKGVEDPKDLNDIIRHIWIESQNKSKVDGDGEWKRNRKRKRNENKNKNED